MLSTVDIATVLLAIAALSDAAEKFRVASENASVAVLLIILLAWLLMHGRWRYQCLAGFGRVKVLCPGYEVLLRR